jgi:hypothetical protein
VRASCGNLCFLQANPDELKIITRNLELRICPSSVNLGCQPIMSISSAVKGGLKCFSPHKRTMRWGMASVFFLAAVWIVAICSIFHLTE